MCYELTKDQEQKYQSDLIVFPFVPQHFPDEIFGSWLTRTAHVNGIKSLYSLRKWFKFRNSISKVSHLDIIENEYEIHSYLKSLNCSPLNYLCSMTTFPYWSNIQVDYCEKNQPLINTYSENLLLVQAHRRSIKLLSHHHSQVCLSCLKEDVEKFGVPYLHRAHQLPNTLVCHIHHVPLISSCPCCERLLLPPNNLALATSACNQCGKPLSINSKPLGMESNWVLLAKFEYALLKDVTVAWRYSKLLKYLKYRLEEDFKGLGGASPKRALTQAFGEDGTKWVMRRARTMTIQHRMNIRDVLLNDLRLPELVALIVAIDKRYESFEENYQRYLQKEDEPATPTPIKLKGNSKPCLKKTRPKNKSEARSQLKSYIQKRGNVTRRSLRQERRAIFWFWMLKDKKWLAHELSDPSLVLNFPIPSIKHDRKLLQKNFEAFKNGALAGVLVHEASVRASYRDSAWIGRFMQKVKEQRIEEKLQVIISRLKQIRVDWTNVGGKPERFQVHHAAKSLGLSVKSLKDMAAKNKIPSNLVKEDSLSYYNRLLLWSVRERQRMGLSLAPSTICDHVKISRTPFAMELAKTIVNRCNSEMRI